MSKWIPTLLVSLLLAPLAGADFVTGRLVDENGVGIANGDVDAENAITGDDLDLTGDSSDANGFFTVAIPNGLYNLTFQGPPGGPLTYQSVLFEEVTVAGTLNVGTIVLERTRQLSGRVVDQSGFPVFPCDLDVFHGVSGDGLVVSGARTDLFGNFSILVPMNIRLRVDPRGAVGPTLAPVEQELLVPAPTTLPDIVLPPGFTVTGSVVRAGNVPIPGAQLDFLDPQGNQAVLFGSVTDAFGNFSFVLAANTWDIEICPPPGATQAPLFVPDRVVTGSTNLGTFTLPAGHSLSGTVTDAFGAPVQGVDVDVRNASTGADVLLCGDGTNASGAYSVRVPAGTYNVFYTVPDGLAIRTNVAIGGPTVLDVSLTPCQPATATFRNGSGANPAALASVSPPRIGRSWKVDLDCTGYANGVAIVILFSGSHPGIPTVNGEFLLSGSQLVLQGRAHTGNVVSFTLPLPPSVGLCGRMGHAQGLILGAPGPQFTNALDLRVGH